MQTFPVFAALDCWQWQKRWALLCGGVVPASKRSYASKVCRLDLCLAFFTASKTSKTANRAWEMSLEREWHNGFHLFHQNFLGNERWDFWGRDSQFVLCSYEAALCKVIQSVWLGASWTFGHVFWSLFAFPSSLPNPNLPHSTLNTCTRGRGWGRRASRQDEECSSREGAERREDLRQWQGRSHTLVVRACRWVSASSNGASAACAGEAEGGSNLPALHQRTGKDQWLVQVGLGLCMGQN